jgi:hypothetical protein
MTSPEWLGSGTKAVQEADKLAKRRLEDWATMNEMQGDLEDVRAERDQLSALLKKREGEIDHWNSRAERLDAENSKLKEVEDKAACWRAERELAVTRLSEAHAAHAAKYEEDNYERGYKMGLERADWVLGRIAKPANLSHVDEWDFTLALAHARDALHEHAGDKIRVVKGLKWADWEAPSLPASAEPQPREKVLALWKVIDEAKDLPQPQASTASGSVKDLLFALGLEWSATLGDYVFGRAERLRVESGGTWVEVNEHGQTEPDQTRVLEEALERLMYAAIDVQLLAKLACDPANPDLARCKEAILAARKLLGE